MLGFASLSSTSPEIQTPSDPPLPTRLAETGYARFWTASAFSYASFQIAAVVIGWQLYSMTKSPFALGLVGLCQFLPMLVLTLPAGQIADRYDRAVVARLCLWIEGAVMLGLASASATDTITPAMVFAAAAVHGGTRTVEMAATAALLPRIVGRTLLPRAVTLATSAMETALVVGPAIGGVIYLAGAPIAYAGVAALYAAAGLLIWSLNPVESGLPGRAPQTLESFLSGVRFVRDNPVILGALSLDLFAVLLGGATALLPVYAKDILFVDPTGLGVLRAAPAAGALLMSLVIARRPIEHRVGPVVLGAVAVFGAATIVFGVSTSFPLSLAALVVMGAADVVSVVIRSTVVQMATPEAMRGRVNAINFLFIGASNQLGEFESGLTAALIGTVPAVVVGGIGSIAVVGLWALIFPALRKIDSLRDL